jgi:hypothetical protein
MIQPVANLCDGLAEVAKIDEHSRGRIDASGNGHFGMVRMTVYAPTRNYFDFAFERVRRLEEELLR